MRDRLRAAKRYWLDRRFDETAVADAVATAEFAWRMAKRFALRVDLNLHAYYPSVRGQTKFPLTKRCAPETLAQAATEKAGLRGRLDVVDAIFIGWQDEGHDQEREMRRLELNEFRTAFDEFNATQDARSLALRES